MGFEMLNADWCIEDVKQALTGRMWQCVASKSHRVGVQS